MRIFHEPIVMQHSDPLLIALHFFAHRRPCRANKLLYRYFGSVVVLENQVLHELLITVLQKHQVDLLVGRLCLFAGHFVADLDLGRLYAEFRFAHGV